MEHSWNLAFALLGAVLAFGFNYLGRKWEVERLQAKGQLKSDLATKRLEACIALMNRYNEVGIALNVLSYGVGILDLQNRSTRRDSALVEEQRPKVKAALEKFYAFIAENGVILGPGVMKAFFWFRRTIDGLRLEIEIERRSDAALSEAAREFLFAAQERFSIEVETVLADAGVKLLKPSEIIETNEAALKELDGRIERYAKQFPDPPKRER